MEQEQQAAAALGNDAAGQAVAFLNGQQCGHFRHSDTAARDQAVAEAVYCVVRQQYGHLSYYVIGQAASKLCSELRSWPLISFFFSSYWPAAGCV